MAHRYESIKELDDEKNGWERVMEMSIDKYMKPQQFKKLGRWGEEEIYKGGENGLDWNVPSTLFPTNLCLSCLRTIWKRGRATVWKRGRATTNHLEERKGNYEPLGERGRATTWRRGRATIGNTSSTLFPTKSLFVLFGKRRTWYTKPSISKQLCQTI